MQLFKDKEYRRKKTLAPLAILKISLTNSLQKHHKRQDDTIFHTAALQVLPIVHQQAIKSTIRLGITQDSPKQLKRIFHKAQATSQWRRRWSTNSQFFLYIQHLLITITCCFLRVTPIWKLMKDACLHILLVIWLRMCNVMSFLSKLWHFFCHPWLFDRNVQHDAYQNVHSSMMCSREIKLVLARDPPMTKLKWISGPFLIKVWNLRWIIGAWLDMKYPQQKLKIRAKPRKKPFLVQEQVSMVVN
jgi:hypothetical protein